MTGEKPDEKAIFNVARRIDSAEARAEYLHQVCGPDKDLMERVETLLSAYEARASFLESPAADLTPTTDQSPITERPGTVIGPYKLLQQIGEGGMGVVFMAEQAEPIQRTVALKIIKPGMDTRQVIARFEAERQALAMMDHPNIAKVLDAGTADSGRPYFVMELVKGVPITKYCDEKQLPLRARLELFVQVCQAVQHAHQKGIIHRDIKPNNVLVAEYDNHAVPKVIDFGVAKAMAQKLTDLTMFTEFGQVLGTMEYMSPEQSKFNQLDIDTRSDIYSLGVMLYELLAGSTPFGGKRMHEAAFDEMLRIIREEEPPKPSTRVSSIDTLPSVAANRHTEPARLSKDVRGELDWIVMKALEKDRNRRYETASGFAADIERQLHDEPVEAGPPSAVYRFRKFARRNKTVLAAGGAIGAALVVGLGLSTWMYLRERAAVQVAKSNEARAKAVSDLMQEMLGSADAEQAKGIQYTVRELLDDFSARLGDQLADQPAVDADIHATIGRAYRSLRLPVQAQPHFEKAIELQRRVDGPQHTKLADLLVDYGWNFENQQKFNEAEAQLHKALEIYRAEGVTGIPAIHALRILELVMYSSGQNFAAESVYQQALTVVGQSDDERRELASLLTVYAGVLNKGRRYEEGEKVARQAVDMDRRLYGDQHPETAWGLRALGMALQGQQKLDEAEPVFRESLTTFRRFYADDHVYVKWVFGMLEAVLEARGDKSALEALASEEAEQKSRSDSPDQQVRLAGLLLSSSPPRDAQEEEAHRLIRRAIEGYGKLAVSDGNNLNQRLTAVGHYMEVARICAVAPGFASELDEVKRILNAEYSHLLITFPDPKDTVDILYCFALARLRLGDQTGYRQACEAMSRVPIDDLDGGHKFRRTWIWCLAPHSIEELRIPRNDAEDALAKDSYNARHTELIVLGGMLYRTGRYEQAAQHLKEFITAYPADPPPGEATINYQRLFLAMIKWQQGQKDEARRMLAETLPDVDEELQSPAIYWNRRASLEVLRREAEDLIGPKEADEDVDNEDRSNSES